MVGSVASMRVASVMRPPSSGTFRSARMKTRFPATSRSWTERMRSPEPPTDDQRDVAHAVREPPLVVVPGEHLAERLVHHARELAVEDRGVRRAVEVRRDELLLAVVEDALQRARGRFLHRRI